MKKDKNLHVNIDFLALTMLLIGEICFFKSETIVVYWGLTGCGMILAIINNLRRLSFKIRKDNFVLWLTLMYMIYVCYGTLYLQRGTFPINTLLYRYIEGVSLYLLISSLLQNNDKLLFRSFSTAGIISILCLVVLEKDNILMGTNRIGDSLSGNVNTVGYNFGIISTVIMWSYCKEKKNYKVFLFVLFSIFMLLTGSKKTLVILVIDILILFFYERKQLSGWLKIIMMVIVGIYIIFNVPYFYDIIGLRIEGMINTLLFGKASKFYSYSTDVRDEMILEAFHLFLNKPIFGGGWNYFYSKTIYVYEYSHCNYTEMLCSFGLIGTILYYSKHLSNIKIALKYRKTQIAQKRDLVVIAVAFSVEALILDWGAVSFSAQSIWYVPVIFGSAAIYAIRNLQSNKRIEYGKN